MENKEETCGAFRIDYRHGNSDDTNVAYVFASTEDSARINFISATPTEDIVVVRVTKLDR